MALIELDLNLKKLSIFVWEWELPRTSPVPDPTKTLGAPAANCTYYEHQIKKHSALRLTIAMRNKYSCFSSQHLSIIEGSRCDWSTKMAVFFPTKVEIENLWVGSKAHLRKLLSPRPAWDSRILPARQWSKNQATLHSFYEVHLAAVHRGSPSTWSSQARRRARSPSCLSSSPPPCPPKPPRCPPVNIAHSLGRVCLCAQTFVCNVIRASPINDLSFMIH